MNKKCEYTVIDFFSGAGGFSEGFRQQGFQIIKGLDFWEPAVKTHNLNHGLNDVVENVLKFQGDDSKDVSEIDKLPDSDVIIGSPSCVTFSMSNKSGKADKTEGIRLIEAYLRVIAVKKHQKNSSLKAWLMENVPNSGNYVKPSYSFQDLNLKGWAIENGYKSTSTALCLNGVVLNASDYGAPQNRNRYVCGEHIASGKFPLPEKTHSKPISLGEIKRSMPNPLSKSRKSTKVWADPNYPNLKLGINKISDHFYDTGLYITEWEQARYLKTMHPYMGKMSFPEDESKSSRTITANKSISSREAIVFKSEVARVGNGEFRAPTIREAATLMGYPYTYQFYGSEGVKWRLIGNSVSPQLSCALAKAISKLEGFETVDLSEINLSKQSNLYKQVENLNTFSEKKFTSKKHRKVNAKFRRAIHKSKNITIDLMNFLPDSKQTPGSNWYVCIFYGTGSDHKYELITKHTYDKLRKTLVKNLENFNDYRIAVDSLFRFDSLDSSDLQQAYESDSSISQAMNPLVLIQNVQESVSLILEKTENKSINLGFLHRETYTIEHLLYAVSMSKLCHDVLNKNPGLSNGYVLEEQPVPA